MVMHFLLNIDIKCDSSTDIDLLIQDAVGIIKNHAMFNFRVVGEPRLLAVLKVDDENVVNTIFSSLIKLGSYTVMCTLLFSFADSKPMPYIGKSVMSPPNYTRRYYHWTDITFDFNVNTLQSEIDIKKLDMLWKLEVEGRSYDIFELQTFKELGKYRVHMFTCSTKPEGTENLKLTLPDNMSGQINKQIKMLTRI